MKRPVYQTERDLRIEREIAEIVAVAGGMETAKIKDGKGLGKIDHAFYRHGRVLMMAEIKRRDQHYPQMFIGFDKVEALRNVAACGLQARVIFATPKGIYAKKIHQGFIDGWIGQGGRKDRGDPKDIQLVVYFGDWVVGGKVLKAEVEPMTRICDSLPEWFIPEMQPEEEFA